MLSEHLGWVCWMHAKVDISSGLATYSSETWLEPHFPESEERSSHSAKTSQLSETSLCHVTLNCQSHCCDKNAWQMWLKDGRVYFGSWLRCIQSFVIGRHGGRNIGWLVTEHPQSERRTMNGGTEIAFSQTNATPPTFMVWQLAFFADMPTYHLQTALDHVQ